MQRGMQHAYSKAFFAGIELLLDERFGMDGFKISERHI